jgi:hypothetical protein
VRIEEVEGVVFEVVEQPGDFGFPNPGNVCGGEVGNTINVGMPVKL